MMKRAFLAACALRTLSVLTTVAVTFLAPPLWWFWSGLGAAVIGGVIAASVDEQQAAPNESRTSVMAPKRTL
jgi:hypothetical protein